MNTVIDGNGIGDRIRDDLQECIDTLDDADVTPGLATVLMSDDPASETYVSMKRRACADLGIESIHHELADDAPANDLYGVIDDLNADPDVNGILVQMPVPDHVDSRRVLERLDPMKDVDGFHPENVGLLVAGEARYRPCTPHGVQKILEAIDVDTEGKDAVIVGRSTIVGKPLANLLLQKAPDGNATVTVCHSRTDNLAQKTRQADILVAAVGSPEFIDGSMVSEGATVIDVGVNRRDVDEQRSSGSQDSKSSDEADTEKGYELVGDVEFESAREQAEYITPVPGGVGPMTITMLLYNTVKAAALQSDVEIQLP